jgi:molecular chaperone DnaK
VYDLGGGTFDISLVVITPMTLEVIATDGDDSLGGKDWDDRLINYLEEQFRQEFGSELVGDDVNELRIQSEKLKHRLSVSQEASVRVQAEGKVGTYSVTREQFEDLTRDLMERTQMLTGHVLEQAETSWSDLSGILPIGGSTRMPMVQEYIKHMSGKPPMSGIHPEEAVALGAAIQAVMEIEAVTQSAPLLLSGRKATTDVITHSLGLIVESEDRSRYVNSIIMRKNLPIPSIQMRPFQMTTRKDGKNELEVFLTQSESEDPQACTYLGRYVFTDFPLVSDETTILDITYEYDKNGIVQVAAAEHTSGKSLSMTKYPVPDNVPARFLERPGNSKAGHEYKSIYLAFDVSGSMWGQPIEEAKKAARRFVEQCDLATTSIGLIAFSDRVHVDQHATQESKDIYRAIDSLAAGSTGGGNSTDPFDDIYRLYENVAGTCYALVLADGVWSHQERAVERAKRCHSMGIQVIAVGFGRADRNFLNRIASSSEQSFFTDMNNLTEAFSTIARELI